MSAVPTNRLVLEHSWLVHHIVALYRRGIVAREDLVQEGMLGLVVAAQSYDARKAKFSTYAYYIVWGKLTTFYRRERCHAGVATAGAPRKPGQRRELARVRDGGERLDGVSILERIADDAPTPEDVVSERQQRAAVSRALYQLTKRSGPFAGIYRVKKIRKKRVVSVSEIAARLNAVMRADQRALQTAQSLI